MTTRFVSIFVLLLALLLFAACGAKETSDKTASDVNSADSTAVKITFIELGSVKCIPCKQMQPVMKSIESRYAGNVKVVFHDVWKDKTPAEQYKIKLIPTQIFLDENGKELMRHEGFFAEREIDKFLQTQGIYPKS